MTPAPWMIRYPPRCGEPSGSGKIPFFLWSSIMSRFQWLAATCLVAVFSLAASGQESDVKTLVRKTIEAHGGEANLKKYKAATVKFTGKIEINNTAIDMTGEQSVMEPYKFRIDSNLQINNMNIPMVQ